MNLDDLAHIVVVRRCGPRGAEAFSVFATPRDALWTARALALSTRGVLSVHVSPGLESSVRLAWSWQAPRPSALRAARASRRVA